MKLLHVLIVENHADTAKYLQLYLSETGHQVDVVSTLTGGIAALSGKNYEVVISDLGLPDGTGWDLLKATAHQPPLLAIAISGYGTSNDRKRSRQAGFHFHLLKPFNLDEIDHAFREAEAQTALPVGT